MFKVLTKYIHLFSVQQQMAAEEQTDVVIVGGYSPLGALYNMRPPNSQVQQERPPSSHLQQQQQQQQESSNGGGTSTNSPFSAGGGGGIHCGPSSKDRDNKGWPERVVGSSSLPAGQSLVSPWLCAAFLHSFLRVYISMSSFLDNKIPGEEQNRADQLTGRILVVDLVSLAAHSIEEKEKEMKRLCVY